MCTARDTIMHSAVHYAAVHLRGREIRVEKVIFPVARFKDSATAAISIGGRDRLAFESAGNRVKNLDNRTSFPTRNPMQRVQYTLQKVLKIQPTIVSELLDFSQQFCITAVTFSKNSEEA